MRVKRFCCVFSSSLLCEVKARAEAEVLCGEVCDGMYLSEPSKLVTWRVCHARIIEEVSETSA
jgi:hypothetical protein